MAIDIATLFTRIGRIGRALLTVNAGQGNLTNALTDVLGNYATSQDLSGTLGISQTSTTRTLSSSFGVCQQLARSTVLQMVGADVPAASRSLSDALTELVRQMKVNGNTVQSCTVTATPVALGNNTGNGVVVIATKRGDGLVQENLLAESARLAVTSDNYSGGQSVGSEQLTFNGAPVGTSNRFDWDWPLGSGASIPTTSITATRDASTGFNLLTNSNFANWIGGNLSNWLPSNGTYGNQITNNSTVTHTSGGNALQINANASVLTALFQEFGNTANGTAITLSPQSTYAVNLWARTTNGTSTGNLTVELVNGSLANTADTQAVVNNFTVNLGNLTTAWTAANGTFRLPQVPPSTVRIQIRVSTVVAGNGILLDDLGFARTSQALYAGGPSLAVFSGSTPWVTADQFNVTTTNNRGNATYLASFQPLFWRLFGQEVPTLLLPSNSTPSISDTLITAT